MPLETTRWDPTDYFKGPEDEVLYLEAALEDGDPNVIAAAIGHIARARGASDVARRAEISREAMYKAFAKDGNPTLVTFLRVLKALGIQLHAGASAPPAEAVQV